MREANLLGGVLVADEFGVLGLEIVDLRCRHIV